MSVRSKMQQNQVEKFNLRYRIGQHVNVETDSGKTITTKTRSEAWLLGGHTATILIEGISGAYLLDRVIPLVRGYGD